MQRVFAFQAQNEVRRYKNEIEERGHEDPCQRVADKRTEREERAAHGTKSLGGPDAERQHHHQLPTDERAQHIVDFQTPFLEKGIDALRPLKMQFIADQVGVHVSTVSRVANSKYVDTPYGTRLIKDYFSEAVKNVEGEDVSTKEIKKILETVIGEEDKRKPLTDDKLARILKDQGYPIARRTVAKYREQLGIPVARLRKEI